MKVIASFKNKVPTLEAVFIAKRRFNFSALPK
jgi:hypothetical protein